VILTDQILSVEAIVAGINPRGDLIHGIVCGQHFKKTFLQVI